jgi:hypothetical protein
MKIESSIVVASSTRNYEAVELTKVTTSQAKWVESSKTDRRDSESELTKFLNQAKQLLEDPKPPHSFTGIVSSRSTDMDEQEPTDPRTNELSLLQQMLDMLLRHRHRKGGMLKDLTADYSQGLSLSIGKVPSISLGQPVSGTWIREVKASNFISETENTSYSSVGIAKTKDGRELNFNIDLEMSRSFTQYSNLEWSEPVVFTDPLIINLESNPTSLSDQKFLFDLDSDGEQESISSLNKGSGYLALDKNNDGIINDGSELFGTKTGNGFADLSTYDSDKNGWIDESDAVFNKLKVWLKDSEGNDKIISLKDADIGAIYLGSSQTEFSLKSTETGTVNGQIRSTGFYLKENGGTGTVQQVDLSI